MNFRSGPHSPLLIAIAGGSGSGKTFLSQKLAAALGPGVVRLAMDDFYWDHSHLTPERRTTLNFDHPRAIDWRTLERVLGRLSHGRAARVPGYDFSTHCRLPAQQALRPGPIVLLDGLWPLRRPRLRRLFGLRIFVACGPSLRLRRRLARDLRARGRTRRSIRDQFRLTVEPMHRRFVEPQANWADIVLLEDWGDWEAQLVAEVIRSLLERKKHGNRQTGQD